MFRWKFWSVMLECKHCFTLVSPKYLLPCIWVPKAVGGFAEFMYIYPKYIVRSSVFSFLDAFAKLRKSTICFVMSASCLVCPSARPHGTTRLPLDGFSRNFLYEFLFRKSVAISQDSLKCVKDNGHFTWRPMNNSDNISLNSSWNEVYYRQNF
jgi:hypothetical protein